MQSDAYQLMMVTSGSRYLWRDKEAVHAAALEMWISVWI